jgi:enoyl-CoA hydratase
MAEFLAIECIGPAMIVRFTRPEIRNPLSRLVIEHLHAILDEIATNGGVERLVFAGTGEAFASGADLNEIAALSAADAPEFARLGQALMQKIADLPQITIAAINGACFGGALDLALSCDRRIASENATFCHPGTGLGIITGWGGTQRLPRLVGRVAALELFLTAEPIDAERAFHIGLVGQITDDPLRAAIQP